MKSKCCNADVFIKEKSGQKCVYCKSCGKFVKNANKDDLIEIEANIIKAFDGVLNRPIPNDPLNVDKMREEIQYYKDSINKLIRMINHTVEDEYDKIPLSSEDAIRKSSKCYELERVRYTLEDILERELELK